MTSRSSGNMLFRYAGNKRWLIPLLPALPAHKRLCELYLGSGSLIFNSSSPKAYGIDTSPFIVSIYEWLKRQTPQSLRELDKIRAQSLQKGLTDVRLLDIEEGARLYLRVNCCGLLAGDFSSYKLYDHRDLPIDKTIGCLENLKKLDVVHGVASSYKEEDGDLVFLDPPYLDFRPNKNNRIKETSGIVYGHFGSGKAKKYNPKDTIELINRISSPIIFCYGTTAKELFPMYDWKIVKTKKVGNTEGKSVERHEYIAYVNWTPNKGIENIFAQ